jgi:hypothetical protein
MWHMPEEDGDLVKAIAALRADLQAAMDEGSDSDMLFGLGDIELTLQLVVTKHGGGKIGWSILAVNAGAQSERSHIVKLTLKPQYRQPDGTYSADVKVAYQADGKPAVSVKRR